MWLFRFPASGHGLVLLPQNGQREILGGGLAVAAGDADDERLEHLTMTSGKLLQSHQQYPALQSRRSSARPRRAGSLLTITAVAAACDA